MSVNLVQTFTKKLPVDVSAPPAWLYGKQRARRGLWVGGVLGSR